MPSLVVYAAFILNVLFLNSLSQAQHLPKASYVSDDSAPKLMVNDVFEGVEPEKAEVDDNDIRDSPASMSPLLASILSRLGKTRELFATSGNYPSHWTRTNGSQQFHSRPALLANFRRNNMASSNDGGMTGSGDSNRTGKHKKGGSLSINGALSSLADMLAAEGVRRDHTAAMRLRQRLLVAGRR